MGDENPGERPGEGLPERGPEHQVTQLFDEYRDRRDRGFPPSIEELERRAGPAHATELRERIEVFERLHSIQRDLDPSEPEPPSRLGRFEILSSLGRGGLSQVYLARDPSLNRQVALKVLDRGLVPDRRERAWILNEARSLAHLRHDGVVRVLEVGSEDGFDFVALEHLSGPDLSQVLRQIWNAQEGSPSTPETDGDAFARELARDLSGFRARAKLFHRLASALAYCHNRGVIHRDIKPANIVFNEEGRPKLIDFGLAHHAGAEDDARPMITEQLVGSAAYVAPEQVEASRTGADPRSDQFSLATMFYEGLALANPFDAPTALQTTQAVLRCELRPLQQRVPNLPADLARIVHHALEREPDARYPTVQELADDLEAFLERRPISVTKPGWLRVASMWLRRNWIPVTGVAALVMTGALTLLASWIRDVREERSAVLQGLAAIDVAGLEQEHEFWSSGIELISLRERAEFSDRSMGRAWFGDPLTGTFRAKASAWSERLASAFSTRHKELSSLWPSLIRIENELCPGCPANLDERRRGRVLLPLDRLGGSPWELEKVDRYTTGRSRFVSSFQPYTYHEELPVGTYRLRVWEDDRREQTLHESVFVVSSRRQPRREIRLHDRDRPLFGLDHNPLFEESVLVPEAEFTIPGAETVYRVPAFRICERWVRASELEAFRETEDARLHLQETERRDLPVFRIGDLACTDLDAAMAFANWVGGRLPLHAEVVAARDAGALEIEWEGDVREWLQDESPDLRSMEGSLFHHELYRPGCVTCALEASLSRRQLLLRTSLEDRQGVALRIVFPAE